MRGDAEIKTEDTIDQCKFHRLSACTEAFSAYEGVYGESAA